jgi:hypothetical protein
VRAIAQWVDTRRDPSLYADVVEKRTAALTGSVLFAYKLNWQTVLFAGYGDTREQDAMEDLQPAARQIFLKVSYALQR